MSEISGAWLVETLILALVLLLVGRYLGYAISIGAFLVALGLGTIAVLGARVVRSRLANKRQARFNGD